MNILVTGAGGMLGSSLVTELQKKRHRVFAYSHKEKSLSLNPLDICDKRAVSQAIDECKPDVVFHLAALTNVDYCEAFQEEARKVNFEATKHIASLCREKNIRLVFISTGAVFSGRKKAPYLPTDRRGPVNWYGKTKMLAEDEVRKVPRHLIIRTGWVIGADRSGKKFVSKILSQLGSGIRELYVVADVKGSPTFSFDLAWGLTKLLKQDASGVYHVVNKGIASRPEIVAELISIKGVSTKINPVKQGYFHEKALRPQMEGLVSDVELPHWKDSLKKYLPLLY